MAYAAADFRIERLMEWGVYRIYGHPGDGTNSIPTTLRKSGGTEEAGSHKAG
jgi:thiamine pyrophosphate-dependent acetolactate synthase large subunit-like protein